MTQLTFQQHYVAILAASFLSLRINLRVAQQEEEGKNLGPRRREMIERKTVSAWRCIGDCGRQSRRECNKNGKKCTMYGNISSLQLSSCDFVVRASFPELFINSGGGGGSYYLPY